ncbi:MAG: ComF family protein [Spirulinaceae cyanobacterium]
MMNWTNRVFKGLLSFFLESNCCLCDRSTEEVICVYCQEQLQKCRLDNPCQFWQQESPLFAWGSYDSTLSRAIKTLKYQNQPQLAKPMGQWLGQAWLDSDLGRKSGKVIVIPIPSHPRKLAERGFNQAELIGRSFCQFTGFSLQTSGLVRVKETEAMFSLNAKQREENIADAFDLGKSFQRQTPRLPVLLLDDIYTTGATIKAATQTLHSNGVRVLGAIALAATASGK